MGRPYSGPTMNIIYLSLDHTSHGRSMRNIYFIGTAGSGKSTLVQAYKEWLDFHGYDSVTVNLDPGADRVPYSADVDIREWVNLDEVMDEYGLGPNGAQIVCADLMAMNVNKLMEVIDTFRTDHLLIDTPGQMELFTFRQSSSVIVDALGRENTLLAFLSDPQLSMTPNGFVSNMMLCAITQFRFSIPVLNLLSKADIVPPEKLERMREWSLDPFTLYSDLLDEGADTQTTLSMEFFKAMENVGMYRELRPVSSTADMGMEEIYNMVQQIFEGGEDIS
jgi:GTPase SAR1 family protein